MGLQTKEQTMRLRKDLECNVSAEIPEMRVIRRLKRLNERRIGRNT